MQNFDDVERLLEGLLEGLQARRKLESLRKKNLTAQNNSDGQVERLEREREKFKRQAKNFKRQVADLTKKFNDAAAEAKFYRETYGELDAAYKLYRTLDESTRSALAGIFGAGDNATTFFSGALQETHLADFWDYAARRPENETLRQLFDFCFAAVNRGFREPPFVRLNVEPGNFFDDELMRRTSQSRQLGKVFRVFLQGYRYAAGKIIKPTIVELN